MSQARAEVTRRVILAAAVELFEEVGYGNTSLTEIIDRAGVTKGGFYYHFHTKEELAAAIIEHANEALGASFRATLGSSAPMLENLIRFPFVALEVMRHDRVVRIGSRLRRALDQVSDVGEAALLHKRELIVGAVRTAVAQGDVNIGINSEAVGHTIWSSVLGTELLIEASGDEPSTRLAELWTVILAAIVPPHSLPRFTQFAARMADRHTQLA